MARPEPFGLKKQPEMNHTTYLARFYFRVREGQGCRVLQSRRSRFHCTGAIAGCSAEADGHHRHEPV